ncbi:hypothetical protein BUALT_Bualt02G0144700 [Buddleja alternifolia]|uniref:Uncharacterized protein n=1 Tax=Buddleja alternifolia TaxID=168488 RepID=A0AAV6Y1R9_9LAMI|nr:hypothetical protein BUALT_Bualt02G0144700 [Buddleja alternifolia]
MLSSMYLLWNLQTLIIKGNRLEIMAPSEIWKMTQLRHVELEKLCLPDPPSLEDRQGDFVLGNLQTLLEILNFKCGEEVVKRIPNIKKLKVSYGNFSDGIKSGSRYCLINLVHLHKLESFSCDFHSTWWKPRRSDLLENLYSPHSLKKLTLCGCKLHWEDITTKVGSLPLLEVLKLVGSFKGVDWTPVEDQFCRLKFLLINDSRDDLEYWNADNTHFPCLEQLFLRGFTKLNEIPSSIGDISTLWLIDLDNCSDTTVVSAKKILDEQEEFGNMDLQIRVHFRENNDLESLAGRNFQVKTW